jgi:ribonucleoside-triphosphate reductase (formate)
MTNRVQENQGMKWMVRDDNGVIVDYSRDVLENSISKVVIKAEDDIDINQITIHIENDLFVKYFKDGSVPQLQNIKETAIFILKSFDLNLAAKIYENSPKPQSIKVYTNSLIKEYLNKLDWRVNENSNMNYSLQGLNSHISSSIIAKYWLTEIYNDQISNAQDRGDLHIHDLGFLGPYCVGWDLQDLLVKGFGGVKNKVAAGPAKHFRTILGQVVNFLYTLQGEAAGAQAFSNFDTLLAPFIRVDNLDYKEVKQALQEFIYNLNVPTRVGFQAPFTNITMDLTPSPALSESPVIIGGEPIDNTYGDYTHEMDMLNKAFAELMTEGDSGGRIFTFPIPTYNIHKEFDFDNPNLIPLWEMTGKYGIPYFSNFVNSDLDPDDVRSMCCRLRLDTKELRKRGGGLFGANPQTGSLGVVTINMPRIGFLAKDSDDFYKRLDELLEIAKDSLETKRTTVEQLTDDGLFPYTTVYLKSVKKRFGTWWANHFSTIGIIGMNEAAINFIGKPITDDESKQWTIEILEYIRDKMQDFQNTTGNYYNLEASPAEGASHRLAKKDKEIYGQIFVQGGNGMQYYTNSVHVPASEDMDVFELLEHQDDMQTLFTGGTVVHLYLGEAISDSSSVKELVRSVVNRFKLPYFSITPTFSVCPVHGYINGKQFYCPYSHSDKEIEAFGKIKEIDNTELNSLNEQSYRVVKQSPSNP